MATKKKSNIRMTVNREYRHHDIYVALSGIKGYGVFADKNFKKGDHIELSPAILIAENSDLVSYTCLSNYVFQDDNENTYLGLGFTSLYNHSFHPNASFWVLDYMIYIAALKNISKGSEIFVHYGYDEKTLKDLNFK
jgi:uncharacterized protein